MSQSLSSWKDIYVFIKQALISAKQMQVMKQNKIHRKTDFLKRKQFSTFFCDTGQKGIHMKNKKVGWIILQIGLLNLLNFTSYRWFNYENILASDKKTCTSTDSHYNHGLMVYTFLGISRKRSESNLNLFVSWTMHGVMIVDFEMWVIKIFTVLPCLFKI